MKSLIIHYSPFLDSLEFHENQENIHPTLTILKVALALKVSKISGKFSRNYQLKISIRCGTVL